MTQELPQQFRTPEYEPESAPHFDMLKADFGAQIFKETRSKDAYRVQFTFDERALVTVRIVFHDATGADVVITNMTTLPAKGVEGDMTGAGYGSRAVEAIVAWAESEHLHILRATQVQDHNADFWMKNGFTKIEGENSTNDYIKQL